MKDAKHHVVDDEQNTDSIEVESERKDRIERYRQAQISHYIGSQMMSGCDVPGDVGRPVDSLNSRHPGEKLKRKEVKSRDLRWTDVGSGVMTRIFTRATRLMTTSKGGPAVNDIESRRVWSLSTGKLIHECRVEDTPN